MKRGIILIIFFVFGGIFISALNCGDTLCDDNETVFTCFPDCSVEGDCNSCASICNLETNASTRGTILTGNVISGSNMEESLEYNNEPQEIFTNSYEEPLEIFEETIADSERKSYIIKFKEKAVLERKTELEKEAENNKERIDSLSNYNPIKYILKASLTEPGEVDKELQNYNKNLEKDMREAERKIKSKLNKDISYSLTGNAVTDEDIIIVTDEFYNVLNAVVLNLSNEDIAKLDDLNFIEEIYEDEPVNISLMDSIGLINADDVWNLNYTGEGITIAIIDTGVDYTHEDLGGCFGVNCKIVGGYDFINGDDNPMDDHGHGTHCAATAAGNGVLRGVAPNAKIYAYKVLNSGGSGSISKVIAGIERSVDPNQDGNFSDHVDIASMSLGTRGIGNPSDAVSQAADNAVSAGVVMVIAAGNQGSGGIGSPGCARRAITVGASCKPNQIGKYPCDNAIASFSSIGPTSIGDIKPDVVAPGVNICAAEYDNWLSGVRCFDTKHIAISGTSMATPHVAGAAALIKEAHPDWNPYMIKDALKYTAIDLGLNENSQGSGQIDVLKAIELINPLPTAVIYNFGKIEEVIDIKGIAYSPLFDYYVLEYGEGKEPLTWEVMIISNISVKDGIIYSGFDVRNLTDSFCTLRLTVADTNNETNIFTTVLEINDLDLTSPPNYYYSGPSNLKIFGSATGYSFENYTLEWGKGKIPSTWSSKNINLEKNGKNRMNDELLGTWNSSLIDEADYYTLRLIAYYSNGKINVDNVTIYIEPSLMAGWPNPIGPPCSNEKCQCLIHHPNIADIENDGKKEILGAWKDIVYVYEYDGRRDYHSGPGRQIPNVHMDNSPVVGDLDGDGFEELVVGTNSGDIYILNRSRYGNLSGWPKKIGESIINFITLSDINNDGVLEILATSKPAWRLNSSIHILNLNGTELPGWPISDWLSKTIFSRTINGLSTGDVDNDGDIEIVATSEYEVGLFESNGSLIHKFTILGGDERIGKGSWSISALGDLDNDGDLEIITAGMGKVLHAWHHNGSDVSGWPRTLASGTRASPVLGDIDGDGNLEVIIGDGYNIDPSEEKIKRLYAFYSNGSDVPGWPILFPLNELHNPGFGTASIGDIDNDGLQEIVVGANKVNLYAFNYDTTNVPNWPKEIPPNRFDMTDQYNKVAYSNSPIIGDIDNDGIIEVIYLAGNAQVLVFKTEGRYNKSKLDWPMLYHDSQHTSSFGSKLQKVNDFFYIEIPPANDCAINLTFQSEKGNFILYNNWENGLCGNLWDQKTDIKNRETKIIEKVLKQGSYALNVVGKGTYNLSYDKKCCADNDNDGFKIGDGFCGEVDCDDNDSTIYPNAPEICDFKDNQCEGNEGYGVIDENCSCEDLNGNICNEKEICSGNEIIGDGTLSKCCDIQCEKCYYEKKLLEKCVPCSKMTCYKYSSKKDCDEDICEISNCSFAKGECINVNEDINKQDRDEDGIIDVLDNCPKHTNSGQEDSDEDGVGDVCDKCPGTDKQSEVGKAGCKLPKYSLFSQNLTTNFSEIENLIEVENFNIGLEEKGIIFFINESFNLEGLDFDSSIRINEKTISVNTTKLPQLNEPATLHFYDVNYITPKILRDGKECSECGQVSYSEGILVVKVPSFSEYTIIEGYIPPVPSGDTGGDTGGGGGGGGGSFSLTTCVPWTCSDWSICERGKKTRACTNVEECYVIMDKPSEIEVCECSELWTCGMWNNPEEECGTRNCIDVNNCGTEKEKPNEKKNCTKFLVIESLGIYIFIIFSIFILVIILVIRQVKGKKKNRHKKSPVVK